MNFKQEFLSRLFITFVCAGGCAALVNFLFGVLFREYFHYNVAVVLAYPFGIVTAYFLNRLFVFGQGEHTPPMEFTFFIGINIFSILLTLCVSASFYDYIFPTMNFTFYAAEVSHLIGIAAPAFTSFLGHKYITFRQSSSCEDS